jgi:ABC-type multidrug transport system ATPase subunit
MKQRLKLLLAFCSNTPLLLLDEPCSNLDENGIKWYRSMLEENLGTRTIIIASNQSIEYEGCQTIINVSQFKT